MARHEKKKKIYGSVDYWEKFGNGSFVRGVSKALVKYSFCLSGYFHQLLDWWGRNHHSQKHTTEINFEKPCELDFRNDAEKKNSSKSLYMEWMHIPRLENEPNRFEPGI